MADIITYYLKRPRIKCDYCGREAEVSLTRQETGIHHNFCSLHRKFFLLDVCKTKDKDGHD